MAVYHGNLWQRTTPAAAAAAAAAGCDRVNEWREEQLQ